MMTRLLHRLTCTLLLLTMLSLSAVAQDRLLADTLEIRFKLDSVMINMHFDGNMQRWDAFERRFQEHFADKDPRALVLDIYSGASPEGTALHNNWLGQERGNAIRHLIRERLGNQVGRITVHNEQARWDGLYQLVAASDEEWRDEVLSILREPASLRKNGRDQREYKLRNLHRGKVWEKLLTDYLPPLRSGASAILTWNPALAAHDTLVVKDTVVVMNNTPVIYECNDCDKKKPKAEKEVQPAVRYPVWILSTNIPLLGTGTPNLKAEFSLDRKDRWSINVEGVWSWWVFAHNVYANEIMYGSVELRYWLGNRWSHHTLDGWHIGLGLGGGYGDLEWKNKGYQAEVYSGFINIGWQKRFGRNKQWAFDASIGLGYAYVPWRRYHGSQIFPVGKEEEYTDHLMWRETGRTNWPGVTHFNISIGYVFPQKDGRWRRERALQRDIERNEILLVRDSVRAHERYQRDSLKTADKLRLKEIELLPTSERKQAMQQLEAERKQARIDAKAVRKQAKAKAEEQRKLQRLAKQQQREQQKLERAERKRQLQEITEWSKTDEGKVAIQQQKAAEKAEAKQARAEKRAAKKQARLEKKQAKIRARMEAEQQRHQEELERNLKQAKEKYKIEN